MRKWIAICLLAISVGAVLLQSCGSNNNSTSSPQGNTCLGAFGESVTNSGPNFGTGYTWVSPFNLTQNAAVTAVTVNVLRNTQLSVGIYTDNASSPQSLLGVSSTITTPNTPGGDGWVTVGLGTPVTLTTGTYWLALGLPATSPSGIVYCNTSSGKTLGTSSVFPTAFTVNNTQNGYHMSVIGLYRCQ